MQNSRLQQTTIFTPIHGKSKRADGRIPLNSYLTPKKDVSFLSSTRLSNKTSPRYSLSETNSPKLQTPNTTRRNGPLLASTQFNVNLGTYTDVKSPGLTSRIVQYSNEQSPETPMPTHQAKYGSPGVFPVVHFFKKDLPVLTPKQSKINSRLSTSATDASLYNGRTYIIDEMQNSIQQTKDEPDISTRSVLDALKEISRKRIHGAEEFEVESEATKKSKRQEYNLNEYSKRNREESPQHTTEATSPTTQSSKRMCVVDPVYASSTSYSMFLEKGIKRKAKGKTVETTAEPPLKSILSAVSIEDAVENSKKQIKLSNAETQTIPVELVEKVIVKVIEKPITQEEEKEDNFVPQLKIFDDTPLEIHKKNKLATILGALTGETPQLISHGDNTDSGKLVSILSPKNKDKHDKHVHFELKDSSSSSSTTNIKPDNPATTTITPSNSPLETPVKSTFSSSIFNSGTALKSSLTTSQSSLTSPSNLVISTASTVSPPKSPGGFKFDLGTPVSSLSQASTVSLSFENVTQTASPKIEKPKASTDGQPMFSFGNSAVSPKINETKTDTRLTGIKFGSPNVTISKVDSTVDSNKLDSKSMFSFGNPTKADPSKSLSSSTTVTFVNSSNAPFGTTINSSVPAFGSTSNTSVSSFGSTSTPNFGMTTSTAPSFPTPTTTSAFGATSAPTFGTSPTSTPIFGATTTSVPAFGNSSLQFGGSSTSAPTFGTPTTTTQPFSSSTTTASSNFVFNVTKATSPFGTPTTTTRSSAFGVGTTAGFGLNKSASVTSFGTPNKDGFGGNSFTNATSNTPNFGVANTNSTTVTTASFGGSFAASKTTFGGNNISTASNFGNTTTTSTFGAPVSSSSIFAFGAKSAVPVTASSTSAPSVFGFGATTTAAFGGSTTNFGTANAFGGQKPSSSTFGSTTVTPAFGAPVTTSPPPAFGTPITTAPPAFGVVTTSTFSNLPTVYSTVFGAKTTAPPAFGTASTTTSFGNSTIFGAATTTSSAPIFGFGGTSSTFGNNNATTTSAFSFSTTTAPAFGASNATPAFGSTTTPAFGSTPTTQPPAFGASSGSFGTPTPAFGVKTTANAFATTNTPSFGTAGTAPAFGATQPMAQSSGFGTGNAFGTQPTSAPAFGTSNTFATNNFGGVGFGAGDTKQNTSFTNNSTPPAFGAAAQSQTSFNAYSSGSNNTQTPGFGFGGNNTAAPKAGVFSFGGPEAPKSGSFNFSAGSNNTTPAFGAATSTFGSPNFGGNASASPAPFNGNAAQFNTPTAGTFSIGAGASRPRTQLKAKRRT